MATYKLTNRDVILLPEKNLSIPASLQNKDYVDYLAWVDAGNTPDPADPEPQRETALTPSQQIILADGVDVALVTITGEPGATVDYTVNGQAFQTTLDASGTDTIELNCDTPNTTLVVEAGTARAVIYAVEVPV